MLSIVRKLKNSLVPDKVQYYTPILGLFAGLRLPLNLRNQFALFIGLHERPVYRFVRESITVGMTCYDIGAASGEYAMAFARLTQNGAVYAIEPIQEHYDRLHETAKLNGLESQIIPMKCFVGALQDQSLNTQSIDGMIAAGNAKPPDIIKIDVDGGEYEILRGAEATIAHYHPILIVEVHSFELERQCIAYLSHAGYSIKVINPENVLGWKEQRVSELNRWNYAIYTG